MHYYDTQQVWFDNVDLEDRTDRRRRGVRDDRPQPVRRRRRRLRRPLDREPDGIAFDELIEEGNFAIPSDNYAMVGGVVQGGYALGSRRTGSRPGRPAPRSPPVAADAGDERHLACRRPRIRCATASPPPGPVGPEFTGILASVDLRRLDAICNPGEPDLTLARGECCGYVARLLVWDNSVCPALSGGRHQIEHHFPFCICNDIKEPVEGPVG